MTHITWSGPAAAGVVGAETVIITVSEEGGQAPLEIVQLKLLEPTPRAVNPDVAEVAAVMFPAPEINVHKPVPTNGTLPARVALVAHIAWSGPAAAGVGGAETVIVTVSEEEGQGALEIVHLNLLAPTPRAVNPDVAKVGIVMFPAPEINVHKPVPTNGTLPARVAVVTHITWSGPAAAGVVGAKTVIITVSEEGGQAPLEMVQLKLLAPTPRAVNPDVAEVAAVMFPVPEINVHKPVPTNGTLPARVAVVIHIV